MEMSVVLKACATAGALLSTTACRTPGAAHADPEAPAVIVNPTVQSRAALVQAITDALDGVSVTLADDAFTNASTLTLERTARRDENGVRLQGRELGTPERFRLVKMAGQCVLIHERSGRRLVLTSTECIPRT
jgi:hypothetical protein